MQAARVHKAGPPEVIVVGTIDVPEPRQQAILVRVRAAGVGRSRGYWVEVRPEALRNNLPKLLKLNSIRQT